MSQSVNSSLLHKIKHVRSSVLNRLLVTAGAIIIYRFATFITLPGIDYVELAKLYIKYSQSFFMFNSISGGALSRMSIMSLNLMPYISATIIMQLLVASSSKLKELKRDPMQRRTMNNYSRFLSLFISILHSIGMCMILESMPGIVINPGWAFRFMTILCVATSSLIALWLSERISSSGIGNGTSMITFLNIVASSAYPVASFIWSLCAGNNTVFTFSKYIAAICILCAILFSFIFEISVYNIFVFIEKSSKQTAMIHKMPMKLNPVGILPAMFAESIIGPLSLLFKNMLVPKFFAFLNIINNLLQKILSINVAEQGMLLMQYIIYSLSSIMHTAYYCISNVLVFLQDPIIVNSYNGVVHFISNIFIHQQNSSTLAIMTLILKSALLAFFAFFCLDFAMEPSDIAYNLRSRSVNIIGYCKGDDTTKFLSRLLNTISNLGAICLVLICAVTPFVLNKLGVSMSGTSIFILIGVAIELFYKFRSIVI